MALERSHRTFILCFVGALGLGPALGQDLFPFTTMPMFSARTTELSWLSLQGPEGPLDPTPFGLATDEVFNPDPRYGLRARPGPNPGGQRADPQVVLARGREATVALDLPWVEVIEETVRIDDDGTVDREETGRWRISR